MAHHGPQNCSTICPSFHLMWTPHCCVLNGANSRAVLGDVRCENSFHFGCKSTLIHSQVPGALQCPNQPCVDHSALGAKTEAILAHHGPQKCSTIRPLFLLMWYPHCCVLKGADSRAVLGAMGCKNSFFFGSERIVIHLLVPGALQCPNQPCVDHSALGAKTEAILAHHSQAVLGAVGGENSFNFGALGTGLSTGGLPDSLAPVWSETGGACVVGDR